MLSRAAIGLLMLACGGLGGRPPHPPAAKRPVAIARNAHRVTLDVSPAGQVRGEVHGEATANDPIGIAAVAILTRSSDQLELTAQCDQDGAFFFGPVPAGSYTLTVVADGWRSATIEVEVVANRAARPRLKLSPADSDKPLPQPQ